MTLHVNQKVVCISEWDNGSYYGCNVPKLNEIYTVRDLEDDGIRLFEIKNSITFVHNTFSGKVSFEEPSFWQCNFRPLVKTDISVFEAMLIPTEQKELV